MSEAVEHTKEEIKIVKQFLDNLTEMPVEPEKPKKYRFSWHSYRIIGELYFFPTLHFNWHKEFEFSNQDYWFGLFWLKWKFYFGWYEI